jgi:Zn-dependent protease with chaperone function
MTATQGPASPPVLPERPRPDVLAYPSPTTSRYLVFVVALLTAGLFVGNWLHNELVGDDWARVVARCMEESQQQATTLPAEQATLERSAAAGRCQAAVERRRAAFAFAGMAAAGAAGLLVLYLAPGVIERRRRLRPLGPRLEAAAERVAALAAQARLGRTPTPVLGTSKQRDGFSYGTPGRYRIALPPAVAVRWRDEKLFDPLVRHELAHVRHRDVALAWLARSVWYALAPLLALPIVQGLLTGDRSLLPDYLWRAALLGVTVQLVSSALLRSREHDADLRAARAPGGAQAIATVVAQAREVGRGPWYRRPFANHPSPARRLAVLDRPELAADVTFLDGFTAAFLGALAIPLVEMAFVSTFTGSGHVDLAHVIAALVAGPLLGGSVGLGLWRAAHVQRVAGQPTWPTPAAFGVAVGLILGHVASLATTAGERLGLANPLALAVLGSAGLGATVLAAGLGEIWADAAPAARHARISWIVALAVNAVLFAAVLWVSASLETLLGAAGWLAGRLWLETLVASWPMLVAVTLLAVTVTWALVASRSGAVTPAWLVEQGESQPWPTIGHRSLVQATTVGMAVGLAAVATQVAFRAVAGSASSPAVQEQRYYMFIWLAAAAGATAALALAMFAPRRGVGAGALAGPLACLIAVAGFLAMNTVLGGRIDVGFVTGVARPPLALGLVLTVVVAPAGLLTWRGRWRVAHIWPIAAAMGLVVSLAVIAARGPITGFKPSAEPPADSAVAEAQHYLTAIAPNLIRRYTIVGGVVAAIDADTTADGPARAARIRTEVLIPLRALLADAEAYQPARPETGSVHRGCVAALRTAVAGFESFAAGFETGDPAALADGRTKRQEEQQHWQAWLTGLTNLQNTARPG